jgi:hypothetical protein
MQVIKKELTVMQASIRNIFESSDFNEAASDRPLVQAILDINDNLDMIADRVNWSDSLTIT